MSQLVSREGRIRELTALQNPAGQALRSHQVFDTDDVTVAQSAASRLMTPHNMRVRVPRFQGRMCALPIGSSAAVLVEYSDGASIEHVETTNYYTVVATLRGGMSVESHESLSAGPGDIVVLPPTPSLLLRYHGDCRLLAVRIPRQTLTRSVTVLNGHRPGAPLRLAPRLTDSTARTPWLGALHLTLTTAATSAASGFSRAIGEYLEQSLVTALLLGHGPAVDPKPGPGPAQRLGPATIRRAAELLDTEYAEPMPIAEVAARVGVSTRRLQAGFQELFGVSPGLYRQNVRLQRAHEQLLAAGSADTTVADIAARCGFAHPGRFSRAYQLRYGTTPSATLHG